LLRNRHKRIIRSAFSSAVRKAGDLSAGVFDISGQMLAQAITGTPGHVNAIAQSVNHFIDRFTINDMQDGDVYITNAPWLATGHLHDFTAVTPCFYSQKLVALFVSTCHVVDIGGRGFGADAREVFEEGLAIPISRIIDAGKLDVTLFEIIRTNVREPLLVEGNLHSLIACNGRGAHRRREMMTEFNVDSLELLANWIIQQSHKGMSEVISKLQPAEYQHQI